MIELTKVVESNSNVTLLLGYQGENGSRRIGFDIRSLESEFGEGIPFLVNIRPETVTPYVVPLTREGSIFYWDVSSTDTARAGYGCCQLIWYVNDHIAKTKMFKTKILKSVNGDEVEQPDLYQNWLDTLIRLGSETHKNAEDAAQSLQDLLDGIAAGDFKGEKGDKGENGSSSTISLVEVENGVKIVVTDANGTKETIINNAASIAPESLGSGFAVGEDGKVTVDTSENSVLMQAVTNYISSNLASESEIGDMLDDIFDDGNPSGPVADQTIEEYMNSNLASEDEVDEMLEDIF